MHLFLALPHHFHTLQQRLCFGVAQRFSAAATIALNAALAAEVTVRMCVRLSFRS
jgi:hypothetical protein